MNNNLYNTKEFDNKTWKVPVDDSFMWDYMITHNKHYNCQPYFWPKKLIETLDHFDCVIQAGGNAGMYSKFYSSVFKTVYTFEPDYRWFNCLVNNCPEENIVKLQAFLGDKHQLGNLKLNPKCVNNLGAIKMDLDSDNKFIPTFTIDDLNVQPDFIHLDIEGFEYHAILGATETISKSKPLIVLEEKTHMKEYGYNRKALGKLMIDLGYVCVKDWNSDKTYVHNSKL
jgi:FkbM family methyltransferase